MALNINPHLKELESDYLYHFGLSSEMDLKGMFGDVRYVCMGGSADRALDFAIKAAKELEIPIPKEGINPIGKTERFSLYKIGPIISVNHGMGMASASICLHEITKLLYYAEAKDFSYIRIGTSGGIGVEPGTVVIANQGLNAALEPTFEQTVLGEKRNWPTTLDKNLNERIYASRGDIATVLGDTVGTDDFYEEQARLDGALPPDYTLEEKMAYLQKAHEKGARNFEMESVQFAAFCLRAGIPAAVVCTTLLNRLNGDQVLSTKDQLDEFSDRAQRLVLRFIQNDLKAA